MKPWKQYQESTADYFRSIGLEAKTDVSVKGVRTNHDIDVFVTSHFDEFDVKWIIECKLWHSPVNKLHVLALREIVTDIGADRGILLSESGFQSGSYEAAQMTNIQLTSLANLKSSSSKKIYAMRFGELLERVISCKDRYWNLSKSVRIEYCLRPEFYEHEFYGDSIIKYLSDVLSRSLKNDFPIYSQDPWAFFLYEKYGEIDSPKRVLEIVEPLLQEFEEKLKLAEQA